MAEPLTPRTPEQVTYKCDNFLDKNKDFVVAEQQELLQASQYDYVRALFPAEEGAEDGKVGWHSSILHARVRWTTFGCIVALLSMLALVLRVRAWCVHSGEQAEKGGMGGWEGGWSLQESRAFLEEQRVPAPGPASVIH